jgi:hypothetical protein
MITAPDQPAKIAPVSAKNRRMAWLCLYSRLNRKMNTATPTTPARNRRR